MMKQYMVEHGLAKQLLLSALVVMALAGVANAADDEVADREEMVSAVEMDGRQLAQVATPAKAAQGATTIAPAVAAKRVEDYFNSITTLKAEFSQSVSGEDFSSEGTFYLQRPRKFVWQYETPVKQKIVSTGSTVYYIDQSSGKDSQVTQLPMSAGLGRIFNAKVLSLKAADLEVVEASEIANELQVRMRVTKGSKDDQAGLKEARMVFAKLANGKLELRRADALDTLGATTTVMLSEVQTGVEIPAKIFAYTPGVYKTNN